MLHDSDGERKYQVEMSACHLLCAVSVLDARGADLVKYLNWFVDLIKLYVMDRKQKREREKQSLQFIVYLL